MEDLKPFTVYAIKNEVIIEREEVEPDMVNFVKDFFEAFIDCDTITVIKSTGSIVTQQRTK